MSTNVAPYLLDMQIHNCLLTGSPQPLKTIKCYSLFLQVASFLLNIAESSRCKKY